MKTVGERIRQAREARGMSGQDLASRVGYKHQSAIANLENRTGGSGGHKIAQIAMALNVPLTWLLSGPDSEIVPDQGSPDAVGVNEPGAVYFVEMKKPSANLADLDPWTREAVAIFTKLREYEKQAALAQLRTFVHNLGPPRDGQALSMAGN